MVFEMSVALHCFAAKELEMSYHNMGISSTRAYLF